ncbi:hypothetical protein AT728_37630 [Streptomyces silvensis]|uniref:Uncharacterized protein n=1 Tax=Streptomyces silvensis TaxID=1765722 RepID=A0A0W7WRC9_9ACTN|nr:hypothetical protein AT728_37630 [Streptomyces silvensis]
MLADHEHTRPGPAHEPQLTARLALTGDEIPPLRLKGGPQLRPFRSAPCDDTDRYHSCPPCLAASPWPCGAQAVEHGGHSVIKLRTPKMVRRGG